MADKGGCRQALKQWDVWCRGNLLLDCTLYNGTEVCFPEGGDMPEQCAPVQTPVTAALSQLMQDGQVSLPHRKPTPKLPQATKKRSSGCLYAQL